MDWQQIKDKFLKQKNRPEGRQGRKETVQADRNKKMAILMTVLMVVFIFVITRAFKPLAPQSANAQSKTNSTVVGGIQDGKINWQLPEEYPTNLRDPMQVNPSADGQAGGSDIVVRGIVNSKDRPSAVIGDKIVHQGDVIGKVTVIKIDKSSVEFEMDGKKWRQGVQQ